MHWSVFKFATNTKEQKGYAEENGKCCQVHGFSGFVKPVKAAIRLFRKENSIFIKHKEKTISTEGETAVNKTKPLTLKTSVD